MKWCDSKQIRHRFHNSREMPRFRSAVDADEYSSGCLYQSIEMLREFTETEEYKDFPPTKWPFDAGIFMGDLNYRVSLPPRVSVSLGDFLLVECLIFCISEAEIYEST
jgi:hypothetical protein